MKRRTNGVFLVLPQVLAVRAHRRPAVARAVRALIEAEEILEHPPCPVEGARVQPEQQRLCGRQVAVEVALRAIHVRLDPCIHTRHGVCLSV